MAVALSYAGPSGIRNENLGRGAMKLVLTTIMVFATGFAYAAHELDDRDLESGKALYAEHCASCHGASLEGQPNWQTA
ncbi:c-type cytochrome, partial [uncultured Roseobacter sp.]|uniref:c-type cytochrome n=1 Tax=uncultured Roseobacter sp. TaxID=114847 RepID=UPI003433AEF9